MSLIKSKLFGLLFFAIILVIAITAFKLNEGEIMSYFGDTLFQKIYPTKNILVDLNGDGQNELIRIAKRTEQVGWKKYNENLLYIFHEVLGKWEVLLQDRFVESSDNFNRYEVKDINQDGFSELICWFGDKSSIDVCIYQWNGESCRRIFEGGGEKVKFVDIDNDGVDEIVTYLVRADSSCVPFAQIFKWRMMEYQFVKDNIPLELDPIHGDRLFLGRGKIAVLK